MTVGNEPLTAVAAPPTAVEGTPFSGNVMTFSDPNASVAASEFTAAITWDDGTHTTGVISPAAAGTGGLSGAVFNVAGSHTFAHAGSKPLSVTITGNGGGTVTTNEKAAVGNAAMAVHVVVVAATEGFAFSGKVASFTDATQPRPLVSSPPPSVGATAPQRSGRSRQIPRADST